MSGDVWLKSRKPAAYQCECFVSVRLSVLGVSIGGSDLLLTSADIEPWLVEKDLSTWGSWYV